MINIATSPGLDTATNQLHIITLLSIRLCGNRDLFSISIKNAIKENYPNKMIFDTIKDSIADNRPAMLNLLGGTIINHLA